MATAREQSRIEWKCENATESLKLGCLQRIADATEIMSKNHVELIKERDRSVETCEWYRSKWEMALRQNAALRGHFTKLKRKMAETKRT